MKKRWQVILDLLVDVSKYLNEDISEQVTNTSKNKQEVVEEKDEENLTDFETIKNLMNESENLKKTSDEELNIMKSFLNSLTDNEE